MRCTVQYITRVTTVCTLYRVPPGTGGVPAVQAEYQVLRLALQPARLLHLEVQYRLNGPRRRDCPPPFLLPYCYTILQGFDPPPLKFSPMPFDFFTRHICLSYDGPKDIYKLFVDGKKEASGSWAGDGPLEAVRYKRPVGHSLPFACLLYPCLP